LLAPPSRPQHGWSPAQLAWQSPAARAPCSDGENRRSEEVLAVLRRLLALPLLVIALILATAPGAFAHATVVATSPGDGQILATAAHQISMSFDEPVQLQFGALRVFSPTSVRIDTGDPSHPGGHADLRSVAPLSCMSRADVI